MAPLTHACGRSVSRFAPWSRVTANLSAVPALALGQTYSNKLIGLRLAVLHGGPGEYAPRPQCQC